MTAYYNENNPFAAAWLRNLVAARLIARGDVDDRSIQEVKPDDVRGYMQCHWFAGIAGWSYALRLAGWDDARPVWTGSCPCQPFSAAGKGEAFDDERHLWPTWFELIRAVRPSTILGEQVDAAIGWGWLDLVHDDMEAEGYAVRSAVLPACGVGAPHIRDRLWFVADADAEYSAISGDERGARGSRLSSRGDADGCGLSRDVAHPAEPRRREVAIRPAGTNGRAATQPRRLRDTGGLMGNANEPGLSLRERAQLPGTQQLDQGRTTEQSGIPRPGIVGVAPSSGCERSGREPAHRIAGQANPWSDLEWLPCTDGKARPTRPGLFPLAHGVSARVGKLRAAGNAIVPQVAAEFIKAVNSCRP